MKGQQPLVLNYKKSGGHSAFLFDDVLLIRRQLSSVSR
jgi:hypothetical protein